MAGVGVLILSGFWGCLRGRMEIVWMRHDGHPRATQVPTENVDPLLLEHETPIATKPSINTGKTPGTAPIAIPGHASGPSGRFEAAGTRSTSRRKTVCKALLAGTNAPSNDSACQSIFSRKPKRS